MQGFSDRAVFLRMASSAREVAVTAFLCECGDGRCAERVRASLREYELAASGAGRFLVAPRHGAFACLFDVIAESARYAIVELNLQEQGR